MGLSLGLGALLGGVASGVLGAGASIGSNVANAKAQESANKANMQIAQMNNDFNERMLQKQMDYNTHMWNKQNQYNSAANQVARLREAGLNPAIAMGNINPGIAQSAQGVNTPTASPVQVNPKQYDFSGVASSIQYALDYGLANQKNNADIKLIEEQAKGVNIENQYKVQEIIANLKNLEERTQGERSKRKYQDIINSYADGMQNMLLHEGNMNILQGRQNLRNQVKAEMLMDKELQSFDSKVQAELASIAADIALKNEQSKLTSNQIFTEITKALDNIETINGKKLDNQSKADLAPYILEKAIYESYPSGPFDVARLSNWGLDRFKDSGKRHFNNFINDLRSGLRQWYEKSHVGNLRKNMYKK